MQPQPPKQIIIFNARSISALYSWQWQIARSIVKYFSWINIFFESVLPHTESKNMSSKEYDFNPKDSKILRQFVRPTQ